MLEDHMETLLARGTVPDVNRSLDGDDRSLIRYPRRDEHAGDDKTHRHNGPQAKVC
jgi:hypothetical protein